MKPLLNPPAEFFRIDIGEGVQLDGYMLKPSTFDASKKYPFITHVYGEPAGQTVNDSWGGSQLLFHRALAEAGYIIISIDNRGTPAPRGTAWRKVVYGTVGDLSSKDQAAAVRALLAKYPFLDRDRVGVWGWSGGGTNTLNAMFRFPGRLQGRRLGRAGARSAALRHDLPGTLHGPAAGERGGLQGRIGDQLR